MYKRLIAPLLAHSMESLPVLTLLGPRQSGKTFLVRHVFDDYEYHSLEDPDVRSRVQADPRGFLTGLSDRVILDEIQRVPQLTSYIQTVIDGDESKKFVLTGSNSSLLTDTVGQTLAGRTKLFELYPLSTGEIFQKHPSIKINQLLFQGGYPRIYQKKLSPTAWLKDYFRLYVEKDIRTVGGIGDLDAFSTFVRLAAGRAGQVLNSSSLGTEAGITAPTVKSWISALKATFICFSLRPYFKNLGKRMVKSPKLYFWDTGLLCYLLGLTEAGQLDTHPLRGHIFENFVVSEYLKKAHYSNASSEYFFFRDHKGHEVDLLESGPRRPFPIEIKMSETFNGDFAKNIEYFHKLQAGSAATSDSMGKVLYLGKACQYRGVQFANALDELKGCTGI